MEELRRRAEIAVDQLFHRKIIVSLAFAHIPQESLKASGLYRFQLFVHALHIRGERHLLPVIEYQMIGRIDALEVQRCLHIDTQRGEFTLKDQRHHEQRWPRIKPVILAPEMIAPPACALIFLDHRHLHARLGEVCRRRKSTDSCPNYDRGCLAFHFLLLLNFCRSVPGGSRFLYSSPLTTVEPCSG